MAVIRDEQALPAQHGQGWRRLTCCDEDVFGMAVPMRVSRYVVEPLATCPEVSVDGNEVMLYVAGGSGSLGLAGEARQLAPESMVWLSGGAELTLEAGDGGLDVLVASVPAAPG